MLLPLFLVVSIIIKFDSKGPVFFLVKSVLVKGVKNLGYLSLEQWVQMLEEKGCRLPLVETAESLE